MCLQIKRLIQVFTARCIATSPSIMLPALVNGTQDPTGGAASFLRDLPSLSKVLTASLFSE
jgi:hypothetical protein